MAKLMKINDRTFMTNNIWKMLNISVEEVQAGIGKQRDENAQLLLIKEWLEQFGEDDLLRRVTLAVRDFNANADNRELQQIASEHGLKDSFYKDAQDQAKSIRDTGKI